MSRAAISIGGTLAFLALCFLCVTCHGPEIQQALAPMQVEPSLRVRLVDGKVELRGTLPDEEIRANILARAKNTYGDNIVFHNLTVNDMMSEAGWMPSALGMFDLMSEVKRGGFGIDKNALTVTGIVKSNDIKTRLLADASAMNPKLTIIDAVEVEAAVVQNTINQFLEGRTIEFTVASANILPSGKAILDTIALLVKDAPDATIEVGGHTDNQGNDKANMTLSRRRADATNEYLVSRGVVNERLTAVGYGETQPVATNFTPEGRQRNRRIVFTLK